MMAGEKSSTIIGEIRQRAAELGIDHIGFSSPEAVDGLISAYASPERASLLNEIFPGAMTVISTALSYNYEWNRVSTDTPGYIARYTTASFYNMLYKKLKSLASFIKEKTSSPLPNKAFFKIFINSRLNDKLACYAAGLGQLLDNSLLSVNGEGPRFVLGELLLAVELPFEQPQLPDESRYNGCRECGKCRQACPTNAIDEKSRINKERCIQHLSPHLHWSPELFHEVIEPHWGKRFFGCTDCVDVCPLNRRSPVKSEEELIGFIGTTFPAEEIFTLKKEDYKSRFSKNQLSAGWIEPAALARNGLLMLYNMGRMDDVARYLKLLPELGWSDDEQGALNFFCKSCLKR